MNSPSLKPPALRLAYFGLSVALCAGTALAGESPRPWKGDDWRARHRVIDLHQHVEGLEERFQRALRINERVGIGVAVNLSGGTVTHKPGEVSEFQRVSELARKVAPDRFLSYFNLDYTGLDDSDFSERAVKQVEEAHRLGAAGLKEYKRLGLTIRNKAGEILPIDDPKLDPVWKRCGELKLPVSIHVADPKAFWLPYNQQNERWKELKDHPKWWFGDPKQFPSREQLLAALDRVIVRHTNTTFVCVHFANNSEDLDWVERMLDTRPNMNADLAARIPEIGRHDPERVRKLFIKHQDRIFFATDFQVYSRLILGSAGDAERPSDDEAAQFFHKEWRWLETEDRDWPHMTPIQGDWNISSIGLPTEVLRKIYFDNARRLLVRSLPFTPHSRGANCRGLSHRGPGSPRHVVAGNPVSSGAADAGWQGASRVEHHLPRTVVGSVPVPAVRLSLQDTDRVSDRSEGGAHQEWAGALG